MPGSHRFRSPLPVDLDLTFGAFVRSRKDPCTQREARNVWWRTLRTAEGPATLRLSLDGNAVLAEAWGPGADVALEGAPDLVGARDTLEGFAPSGVVRELSRRLPGLRIPRARHVFQCLVLPVLEQKVAGREAWLGYAALLSLLAEPAPGPRPLALPPDPAVVARLPSFQFRSIGIEGKRADTLVNAAKRQRRLAELPDMPLALAHQRLQAIRGIGAWTSAEVARVALGDADAVSVGDYNLPRLVAYNLLGETQADDARMLELLAPFAGHRGRVCLLFMLGGASVPRRGPRMALRPFSSRAKTRGMI
ncbi:MAG: DNA-3-methyladenine glycosylase 2 family protein [Myxococcales bacterium]|nr:DNA-3-methyladenine glycosylase 2 family protein [Myxococcales bacterium]